MLEPAGKLVNRYPDANILAHKDVFSQMMNFASAFNQEIFDFAPPTFTLPSKYEKARLDEYMAAHKNITFIAKPQVGS